MACVSPPPCAATPTRAYIAGIPTVVPSASPPVSCCSAVDAPLSDHAAVPPSALGRLTAQPPRRSAAAALRHPSCLSPQHPCAHATARPTPTPILSPHPHVRHFGSATLTSPHRLSTACALPCRPAPPPAPDAAGNPALMPSAMLHGPRRLPHLESSATGKGSPLTADMQSSVFLHQVDMLRCSRSTGSLAH
ncbi:hypothetical protein U9M48_011428 [Paspalum notatum var. saurae]|uniref:Uncharacterized protein n=1 Tax=Paspalum notatum var. saurae TaxID=547442 RepID=A0AAQ3SVQ3_PASNO